MDRAYSGFLRDFRGAMVLGSYLHLSAVVSFQKRLRRFGEIDGLALEYTTNWNCFPAEN